VPLVDRVPKLFSLEDVPEVTSTVVADDLDTFHEHASVDVSADGTGDGFVEGRPTAPGIAVRWGETSWSVHIVVKEALVAESLQFGLRLVERSITGATS
jgi:hypothetical protein